MIRKNINLPWPFSVVFILIWLLGFSYLQGYWNHLKPSEEWIKITNDYYQFSVDYPSKWSHYAYKETGSRGARDTKFEIYQSNPRRSSFLIRLLLQESENPPLSKVAAWGRHRNNSRNNDEFRSRFIFREVDFREYFVDDELVFVRRYGNIDTVNEQVYISRPNDMIIIELQAETDEIDEYLDDFYRIVDSFRTLE